MMIRRSNIERGCARRFKCWPIVCFCFLLASCGAPGVPTPPSPPIPITISDLTGQQAGDGVRLTFTIPAKSTKGDRLTETPAVEVLRANLKPDNSIDKKSWRNIYTLPGALVKNYRSEGHVSIVLPVAAEDINARPGSQFVFAVRTRVSKKRASAESNAVTISLFPVPEKIESIQTHVTRDAIELSWTAHTQMAGGAPFGTISEYSIYRGDLEPDSIDAAAKDLSQARWKAPLLRVGSSGSTTFTDKDFVFGKTYLYVVRSVVLAGGTTIESNDSTPAVVTPKDVFPPAFPEGLIASVIAPRAGEPPEVDLSWSISMDGRVAGYRVYRSEQENTQGQLITPELLLSPAYRDTSIEPGHNYWYRVTAVDRAGNESTASTPVNAEIAKPSL